MENSGKPAKESIVLRRLTPSIARYLHQPEKGLQQWKQVKILYHRHAVFLKWNKNSHPGKPVWGEPVWGITQILSQAPGPFLLKGPLAKACEGLNSESSRRSKALQACRKLPDLTGTDSCNAI